jgi:RNA polymerase sigma-70 factor (ECF subfamily)
MQRGRPLRQAQTSAPDERLLIEAAQRDPARFAELYDIYFDRIYAYVARRVGSREETEDLVSEVFHRALANLRRFEWQGAPFSAWLFRIAANEITDLSVRLGRERTIEALPEAEDGDQEEAQDRSTVLALVRELPEDQRRVLELRFMEEKSTREVAQVLGRSEGAIKQLQFRGLQILRARVGGKHA